MRSAHITTDTGDQVDDGFVFHTLTLTHRHTQARTLHLLSPSCLRLRRAFIMTAQSLLTIHRTPLYVTWQWARVQRKQTGAPQWICGNHDAAELRLFREIPPCLRIHINTATLVWFHSSRMMIDRDDSCVSVRWDFYPLKLRHSGLTSPPVHTPAALSVNTHFCLNFRATKTTQQYSLLIRCTYLLRSAPETTFATLW